MTLRRPSFRLAAIVPAIVVASVGITAAAGALLALHLGRAALVREELDRLRHAADSYASAVRFYLDGARATIEATAPLPELQAALAADSDVAAPRREAALAAARLRAALILQHSRVFDDVTLLDALGKVVLVEPAAPEAPPAWRDRSFTAWYAELMRARQTVFSDLKLSLTTLRPTVVVASPVRDATGRIVGVWAGSLRLAELSRVGVAGDRPHAAYGFVTDGQGLVIAHQAQPRYVQYQTDFSSVHAVRAALAGQRGTGRFPNPIERTEQLGAWVPLPETRWAVVYEWPVEAALAPIGELTRSFLPLAIAIAAGLGLAGMVLARRVVRPIEKLTETADRLPVGGARFEIERMSSVEVERLAHALNRMVAAIDERDAALRHRAEEAERLVRQLEAANRSKDEFLATVSHELRTPLNAVYGWARMLQGPLAEPARAKAVDAIVRNSNAQVQLIDDLLDVARISTGKMRLDVRTVDLLPVVEAAIDAVRPAMDSKGLRLQSVLDPRAGPVMGDPGRLQQVVWNLMMNSVKFTPRGGVIQVHLRRVDSHVEVAVSDSGEGIEAHLLPLIFDRFQQADSTSTRTHGGLGLGLALVRHLVELHGGTVAAHSPGPGQGATFLVKLPVSLARIGEPTPDRTHPTAEITLPTYAGPALDGVRVLVVDDDPDSLALATAILAAARADLKTASSAPEALGMCREWPPDVVIADIEMPGEDGYSLIRKIRLLGPSQGGRVPAVAVTAYGRAEDRVRTLSAGFNMHIPKPVDPAELIAVVASLAGLETSGPAPAAAPAPVD